MCDASLSQPRSLEVVSEVIILYVPLRCQWETGV